MSTTSDTSTSTTTASLGGWVITMPSGHPYCWYRDGVGCTDAASALALFEADTTNRQALVAAGWSARPGSAVDFYSRTQATRIPA